MPKPSVTGCRWNLHQLAGGKRGDAQETADISFMCLETVDNTAICCYIVSMRFYLQYNKELTEKAKELRNHMTPEESKLWYHFFRSYPIRFSRQKQVDNYILDFYCAKIRLCIEIDGNQHASNESIEYDRTRKWKLKGYGI